jgi:hypothetical protein
MWIFGSQIGWELVTALVQVFTDPYKIIRKHTYGQPFHKVMAILRFTELLLTKNIIRKRIYICSDSRAVSEALAKITTKSSLVWE